MTPALKTPETIARIRAHASVRSISEIAFDLGWDVNRLQRTAREFQIELCGAAMPSVAAREPTTPPPTPTPPLASARTPRPQRPKLHLMTLDEMIIALPRRQANVLSILRKAIIERKALTASEIGDRCGYLCSTQAIINAINMLRAKLRGSHWRIESSKGPGGGFRLMSEHDGP